MIETSTRGAEFVVFVTIPLRRVFALGVGEVTGVGAGVIVGATGEGCGTGVGVGATVGTVVGTVVGVGTIVGIGVGVGFSVSVSPVVVRSKTDWSFDTIWILAFPKLTVVVREFAVFVFKLSLAIRKAPEGGEDSWEGSSPKTIEIRPVVFASDIGVTFITLAKDEYGETSLVSLTTLGSNVIWISLKLIIESEFTQTSKLLSGGSEEEST